MMSGAVPDGSPEVDRNAFGSEVTPQSLSKTIPPSLTTDPKNYRLSQPWTARIPFAMLLSASLGIILGSSHGAQTTAMRYRAENAHRLPTSQRGWYLYHKSKNYVVMVASVKEGFRMAGKLAIWTGLFFALEEVVDRGRVGRAQVEEIEELEAVMEVGLQPGPGWLSAKLARGRQAGREKRDVLSTVTAGLTTAGAFSAWNRLPWNTAARTVKLGFFGGLGYGLAQDAVTLLQGKHLAYVDWTMKMIGLNSKDDVERPV